MIILALKLSRKNYVTNFVQLRLYENYFTQIVVLKFINQKFCKQFCTSEFV